MKVRLVGVKDSKFTISEILFNETSQGVHAANIPITFGISNGVHTLLRTVIEGQANDNGRNRRRVLVRVSFPYQAYTVDPATSSVAVDPSRSGGEVSMHLVLAVPKALREDLVSGDTTRTAAANAALQIAQMLLGAASGLSASGANVIASDDGTTTAAVDANRLHLDISSLPVSDNAGSAMGVGTYSAGTLLVTGNGTGQNGRKVVCPTPVTQDSVFGLTGLQIDTRDPAAQSSLTYSNDACDPLVRGLHGLVPIEENTSIVAPTAIAIRSSM